MRETIAAAAAPLTDYANECVAEMVSELGKAYALATGVRRLTRGRMDEQLEDTMAAFRGRFGRELPVPAQLTTAFGEFDDLFAIANVAVPDAVVTPSARPDLSVAHATSRG